VLDSSSCGVKLHWGHVVSLGCGVARNSPFEFAAQPRDLLPFLIVPFAVESAGHLWSLLSLASGSSVDANPAMELID